MWPSLNFLSSVMVFEKVIFDEASVSQNCETPAIVVNTRLTLIIQSFLFGVHPNKNGTKNIQTNFAQKKLQVICLVHFLKQKQPQETSQIKKYFVKIKSLRELNNYFKANSLFI
jgi:hypothetical protein